MGAALILAAGGTAAGAGAYFHHVTTDRVTIPGLTLGGLHLGGVAFASLDGKLGPAIAAFLAQPMTLTFGGHVVARRTRAELGIGVDEDELVAEIERKGHTGDPFADFAARGQEGGALSFPVRIDRQKALAFLADLKGTLDRPPVEAHLDLDAHTVTDSRDGLLLDAYGSLDALAAAARAGAATFALAGTDTPPRVSAKDLANIDISHVVGYWETDYSTYEVDRDDNLKIAADRLNGHVLMPGEVFSFNAVVGPRTERQGYHVAPVIDKGELVDGLAGGACQISTTLHAAAFFAGLDIVSTTPHSRPAHYITMGLDSTVVYPVVDLKLKNNFDFPIVIHYQVNQGKVRVELLGKERPYKVVFKRKILEVFPYETETREDPDLPAGLTIVDQGGLYGYHLKKERFVYDHHGRLVMHNTWDIKYPPTTEYDRIGTGDPSLPPPPVIRTIRIPKALEVDDELKIVRPLPGQP